MALLVSNEQSLDILAKCSTSILDYCKVFHNDVFYAPFSKGHHALAEAIDDPGVEKLLVKAHRHFGKSSLLNLAVPAQHITFKKSRYIVPISATATQAIEHSENLKRELLTNELHRELLGNIQSDTWTREEWITNTGCKVFPRGSGQQIRGINWGTYRMDLGICDDLEKTDRVSSEDQRRKLKKWFYGDFLNSVDRLRGWRIIVIGTVLHESSLLEELSRQDTWTVVDIPLAEQRNSQLISNWPEFMSDQEVGDLLEEYREAGMADDFYREFMNKCASPEDRLFQRQHFQYYDEGQLFPYLNTSRHVDTFILVDPTKTTSENSCYSAVVGVSIDNSNNRIYVRDIIKERLTTEDLYQACITMASKLNAKVLGVEFNSLNEYIEKPLRDFLYKRGVNLQIVELKPRNVPTDARAKYPRLKDARIYCTAPYYRGGHIYHNPSIAHLLEDQLLSFPNQRDTEADVMDAFSYFIQLAHLGNRFFVHEISDQTGDEQYFGDEEEEYYNMLMEEDDDPEDWLVRL